MNEFAGGRRTAVAWGLGVSLTVVVVALVVVLSLGEPDDAESHLSSARAYLAKGDGNAALVELRTALQVDPRHVAARRELARLELAAGDPVAALADIERLRALGVADEGLQTLELKAMLSAGEYAKVAGRLATFDPASLSAGRLNLLAAAQSGLGKAHAAQRSYEQALEQDAGNREAQLGLATLALARGDGAHARTLVSGLLAANPDDLRALVLEGRLALADQRYDSAERSFARAVAVRPTSRLALAGLLAAQLAQARLVPARETLGQLVDAHPRSADRWLWEARLARAEEEPAQAIAAYRELIALTPDYADGLTELAGLLARTGERQQAMELLRRALRVQPTHRQARLVAAAVEADTGASAEAIRRIEALADDAPNDARLPALIGQMRLREGDPEGGIAALERAAAMDPSASTLQSWLGEGYLATGANEAAVDALAEAARLSPSVRNDAMLAFAQLRAGDPAAAVASAERARAREPENPLAHFVLGTVAEVSGSAEMAEAAFSRALALDPAHLWTRLRQVEKAESDPEEALELARALVELHPQAWQPAALLGRVLARASRFSEAQAVLARFANDPRAPLPGLLLAQVYLAQGRGEDALRQLERLDGEPAQYSVRLALAKTQLSLQRWGDAARTLTSLTPRYSAIRDVAVGLGLAQLRSADPSAAARTLQEWLEREPNDPGARLLRAQALVGLENLRGAREIADALLADYPERAEVWGLSASIAHYENRHEAALAGYERALGISASGALTAGKARALARLERVDEALQVLQRRLAEHPGEEVVEKALAELSMRAARNELAIAAYERVIDARPNDVTALNNLAWLLIGGAPERAQSLAKRAYELSPEHPSVLDTYGWVLASTGNPEQGIRYLQRAVDLMRGDASHRYRLAVAYARANERAAAVVELRAALKETEFPERDDALSLFRSLDRRS